MKHKMAEKLHAIKRFKERLGVELTLDNYNKLCEKCTNRKYARFVRWTNDKKYGRMQLLEIEDFGFRFLVLYNPIHFCIVTVMFAPIIKIGKISSSVPVKKVNEIDNSPVKYANPENWKAVS